MANAKRLHRYLNAMHVYGITEEDALALRRIQMTLHRWHELECGNSNDWASWAIERDEKTDKPYMIRNMYVNPFAETSSTRTLLPDREKGALKRLATIMARYPALVPYVQGDPRGCALYVVRKSDVPPGQHQLECYYTRGIPCTEE